MKKNGDITIEGKQITIKGRAIVIIKGKNPERTDGDAVATAAPAEVVIGRIISAGDDGAPMVDFPDNRRRAGTGDGHCAL